MSASALGTQLCATAYLPHFLPCPSTGMNAIACLLPLGLAHASSTCQWQSFSLACQAGGWSSQQTCYAAELAPPPNSVIRHQLLQPCLAMSLAAVLSSIKGMHLARTPSWLSLSSAGMRQPGWAVSCT